MSDLQSIDVEHKLRQVKAYTEHRSIVLVGLMGCGKSTIGRRLAKRLSLPFYDSDDEIEKAARMSVIEIFAQFGEEEFRRGEKKVINRLLEGPQCVIATGGGAFMAEETRTAIAHNGLSVWLKADLDTLMERVARRNSRPLLQTDNPRQTMQDLMDKRYPIYEKAAITCETGYSSKESVVTKIVDLIALQAANADSNPTSS